jgi:phage terminase large subunit-like protein
LIVSRKVVHDGNPLLTWALSNAYAYTDSNGNIKLSKKNKDDSQRIDPAAAVINALARLPMAKSKRSKYEDDELMML